jgi:hypothetical protein
VQIKPAFVCRVTPFLKGLSVLRGWHHNCTIHQHLVVRTLPLSGQFMAQSAGLRARTNILAAVLALAWTVPGLIHAQSITEGRVVGEVVSPQGAPIGKPQVTLLSQSTGSRISLKADYLGRFNLHLIAPGTYSVLVELAGYQPFVRTAYGSSPGAQPSCGSPHSASAPDHEHRGNPLSRAGRAVHRDLDWAVFQRSGIEDLGMAQRLERPEPRVLNRFGAP